MPPCKYCKDSDTTIAEEFMICQTCHESVHVKCLKQKSPGDLFGDTFFNFTCTYCSSTGSEMFSRIKLQWVMAIVLTLYNLSIKCNGLSRLGYFHWRTHIVNFIDKNWEYLFGENIKRKRTLVGTIAGNLSHHSPTIFSSGQDIFNEAGWWKLSQNENPLFFHNLLSLDKKDEKLSLDDDDLYCDKNSVIFNFHKNIADGISCSRTMFYNFKLTKNNAIETENFEENSNIGEDNLNIVQASLMDFLAENLSSDGNIFNEVIPFDNSFDLKPCNERIKSPEQNECIKDYQFLPRIVQVTNFQNLEEIEEFRENVDLVSNTDGSDDESGQKIYGKSLFTKTIKRSYPWVEENNFEDFGDKLSIHVMSTYEEVELYCKLRRIISLKDKIHINIPSNIRRLYRKLSIRDYKRQNGKYIFNIEKYDQSKIRLNVDKPMAILDRYTLLSNAVGNENNSFSSKIIGSAQYEFFESPYSRRVLHPFIYKSSEFSPIWSKLMSELKYVVNNEVSPKGTIDFCYIRPYHIAAVNSLLEATFWPGIDMSETLSYPDYTVVAVYKKLVVGCAFLVPDVNYNEVYISFMTVRPGWQRCGIASFMLYHLIQTSLKKDITLHVSASNPAVCLYQKFGFKIEETILSFYEKYIPFESSQSKHAFFLRLSN